MKSLILTLAAMVLGWSAHAQDVSLSRAAELGCHRIERLRDLGRIDAEYVDKFHSLRIEENSTGGGKFQFTAYQVPASNGSAHQIELQMDSAGKVLGPYKETKGFDGAAPVWPDKDPVTLVEAGLHFVIDNGPVNSDIAPFFNAMTEAVINQVRENGQILARVQFKNSQSPKMLEITLKPDGTVISNSVK